MNDTLVCTICGLKVWLGDVVTAPKDGRWAVIGEDEATWPPPPVYHVKCLMGEHREIPAEIVATWEEPENAALRERVEAELLASDDPTIAEDMRELIRRRAALEDA